jgi:hypothetical protein
MGPEPELKKIASLKPQAQEEFGGFSTGISFWVAPHRALEMRTVPQ